MALIEFSNSLQSYMLIAGFIAFLFVVYFIFWKKLGKKKLF